MTPPRVRRLFAPGFPAEVRDLDAGSELASTVVVDPDDVYVRMAVGQGDTVVLACLDVDKTRELVRYLSAAADEVERRQRAERGGAA